MVQSHIEPFTFETCHNFLVYAIGNIREIGVGDIVNRSPFTYLSSIRSGVDLNGLLIKFNG